MANEESASAHIVQSLIVNVVIVAGKGFAAAVTGSGAILAETIHSAADCSNQLLLLLGLLLSRRKPTDRHPLGFGREVYFWSFIVALLLFSGGGVFSLYEGYYKLNHPEPVHQPYVGVAIIVFALMLEGYATFSNLREIAKRKGSQSLPRYLRDTKDSDLIVVFGENSAATLGLVFALLAQVASWATGDSRWDAIGCVCIGVVLIGVALFLAIEVRSLLVGESASPALAAAVRDVAARFPEITAVLHTITVQQGPGQVLLLVKLGFNPSMRVEQLSATINHFEGALRECRPDVRWCFVEPDMPRAA